MAGATSKYLVKVENRLLPTDTVAVDATVSVTAASVSKSTNKYGYATLSLADGAHQIHIKPKHTSIAKVGPKISFASDRAFRSLSISVKTKGGQMTVLTPGTNDGVAKAGASKYDGKKEQLKVRLQPVWIKSPNHSKRTKSIDLVVVHHTSGTSAGSSLNEFLTGSKSSSHYLLDTDGQLIKMVAETSVANHAGNTYWRGATGVNATSVGIEIVHKSGDYKAAQYTTLIELVQALVDQEAKLKAYDIVGHGDVGVTGKKLGRKEKCPGGDFDWSQLEAKKLSLGVKFGAEPDKKKVYGGFFDLSAAGGLKKGDNDKQQKFGGATNKTVTGTPIQDLQNDLMAIGYSVDTPDGDFDDITEAAVSMFQLHFDHKGLKRNGVANWDTAKLIRSLAAGISGK